MSAPKLSDRELYVLFAMDTVEAWELDCTEGIGIYWRDIFEKLSSSGLAEVRFCKLDGQCYYRRTPAGDAALEEYRREK